MCSKTTDGVRFVAYSDDERCRDGRRAGVGEAVLGVYRLVLAGCPGGSADLIVRLSTGGRLAIPREHLHDLRQATEGQLPEIQL